MFHSFSCGFCFVGGSCFMFHSVSQVFLCFQGDQKGTLERKGLSGLMLRNLLEAATGDVL